MKSRKWPSREIVDGESFLFPRRTIEGRSRDNRDPIRSKVMEYTASLSIIVVLRSPDREPDRYTRVAPRRAASLNVLRNDSPVITPPGPVQCQFIVRLRRALPHARQRIIVDDASSREISYAANISAARRG